MLSCMNTGKQDGHLGKNEDLELVSLLDTSGSVVVFFCCAKAGVQLLLMD